ncbi:MAG: Fe-S cluster assembly protein SufD [Bacteroidales bacterium]
MPHKMIDKIIASGEYRNLTESQQRCIELLKDLALPNTKQEEYQNTDFSDVFDSVENIAFENIGVDYIENEDTHIITVRNNVEESTEIDTGILSISLSDNNEFDTNKDVIDTVSHILANKEIRIYIKDNAVIEKPIIITNKIGIVGSDLYSANIKINAGINSKAQIVVKEESEQAVPLFIGSNCLEADSNADIEFYHLIGTKDTKSSSGIIKQQFTLGKDANIRVFNLSLSGYKYRIESNIDIKEEGAHADIQGIAFLAENQLLDNHVYINHLASKGRSKQLFKYIIDDVAQGVFSGLINIAPNSQQVEAYQRNNNILLADTAKMHTKPQLIIDADDVKCSHGATTGQIDEQAMFYMRSRGIDEQEARSMLIDAFLDEVIANVALPQVRELVRSFTNKFFKN